MGNFSQNATTSWLGQGKFLAHAKNEMLTSFRDILFTDTCKNEKALHVVAGILHVGQTTIPESEYMYMYQ